MQPTKQQLENQVATFNAAYPVGTRVQVMKRADGSETFEDTIRHAATILGGHTAVTWLEGRGSYDLTFVIGKADDLERDPMLDADPVYRVGGYTL